MDNSAAGPAPTVSFLAHAHRSSLKPPDLKNTTKIENRDTNQRKTAFSVPHPRKRRNLNEASEGEEKTDRKKKKDTLTNPEPEEKLLIGKLCRF